MTADTRDSSPHVGHHGHRGSATAEPAVPRRRPRWLLPAVGAMVLMAALVVFEILSLSTAIYASLVGGMLLMHIGGHGHDGHTGKAPREALGGGDTAAGDNDGGGQPTRR